MTRITDVVTDPDDIELWVDDPWLAPGLARLPIYSREGQYVLRQGRPVVEIVVATGRDVLSAMELSIQ